MSAVAMPILERRMRRSVATAGGVLIALLAGGAAVEPRLARWGFAGCLLVLLAVAAGRWPRTMVVSVLCFLPFLALFRRVLLGAAPWTSYDPLVLLGPAAAAMILIQGVGRRLEAGARAWLTLGVLVVIGMAVLEVGNPAGGGVKAGLVGLLFIVGPLLWYFVGLRVGDETSLGWTMRGALIIALIAAAYGLAQIAFGFPSWDRQWLDWVRESQGSLGALQVNNAIRAFASFSSFAEYSTYLAAGVVFCVALAVSGRKVVLLALPLLLPALFLASARGPFLLAIFGSVVIVVARVRRVRVAIAVLAAVVGVLFAGSVALKSSDNSAASSSNGLVTHQLGGLADPFNAQASTLGLHLAVVIAGLKQGITHPAGSGPASTNLAGQKLGGATDFTGARQAFAQQSGLNSTQNGTEFDISDAFVALGLVGGLAYLTVFIASLRSVLRLARRRLTFVWLGGLGLLVVMIGQWLNGGFYALAPLLWFVVGASVRVSAAASGGIQLESVIELERTPLTGDRGRAATGAGELAGHRGDGRAGERRVVFANHTGCVSGGELALLDELVLLRTVLTPIVACPKGELADRVRAAGYAWREVPGADGGLTVRPRAAAQSLGRFVAHGRAVGRVAAESGAAVVYANTIRSGLGVALVSRRGERRLVVAVHDCLPPGRATEIVQQAINRRADLIVTNSQYTASRWAPSRGRRPPIRIVYPGHNPDRMRTDGRREAVRAELGIDQEATVLILLAQITPWKGQETAIRALARLRADCPELRLLVVGDILFSEGTRFDNFAYARELRRLVEQAELTDAVTFTGYSSDIAGMLAAADVALQPSWEEPFGISVVEAMAAGLPVIATSVGGPPEIIRNGVDGWLADPRDSAQWARIIRALVREPDRLRTMGEAARARARDFEVSGAVREIWDSLHPMV